MRQSRSVVRVLVLVMVMAASGVDPGRSSVAAQAPAPPPPAEGRLAAGLATRYHLVERYTTTEDRTRPELIGQYRVALRETIRTVTDNPRGAPTRSEGGAQTIYAERPAQVSDRAAVTAAVRRYEVFRIATGVQQAKASATRPLEGLTIWYEPEAKEDDRRVLCLTENRHITDNEYAVISRQVFLPALAANVLPPMPRRVGESWALSPLAVKSLVGEPPLPARGGLSATLAEVREDAKAGRPVAVININGKVGLPSGEASVNAQLLFSFAPPAPAIAPAPGPGAEKGEKGDEGTIEAWGAITEVRLAIARTGVLPGATSRLRRTVTNELVLERQLGGGAPPLTVPEPPPSPTEANAWLTYLDPLGRFHFQHPQELRAMPPPEENVVELFGLRGADPDYISIELIPKSGDPQEDANNRDPEFYRKSLNQQWLKDQVDVIRGQHGWLPEPEWKPSNMEVYHIEAAVKPDARAAKGKANRKYADFYLVRLSRPDVLFVKSWTTSTQPTAFRAKVEAMLKTFRFGAPEDVAKK